jgi:hypothetical protein
MAHSLEKLNDCGCCVGTDPETPVAIGNRPGLPAVAYRAGSYAGFRESIAARLSSSDFPPLAALRARDDGDFTLALADAFAVMADVLTFYQERLANEAFLRTATERRSVLELARLIGYELAPGVAASAWLAFTLEEARGAPAQAARPVTIAAGTKVQSVPGPDELPQTFETVAPIEARVECNAIRVQTREPQTLRVGLTEFYFAGTSHQLQLGDVILFVGDDRAREFGSERWDVRLLKAVETDEKRGYTRVTWQEGLGHDRPRVLPAGEGVEVFVFRQRAALFGHNAPDPRLLSSSGTRLGDLFALSTGREWNGFEIDVAGRRIDLDQMYPKIVPGSWVALVRPPTPPPPSSLPGYVELYRASSVAHLSRSDFGLSAKVTRIGLDTGENLGLCRLRHTLVLAQSEELPPAERPVREPLYGEGIALAEIVPGLTRGQPLAVSGKRQHLRVAQGATGLSLTVDGGRRPLSPGDRLALVAPPTRTLSGGTVQQLSPAELLRRLGRDSERLEWRLADRDGRIGRLDASADKLELDAAHDDDAVLAEIAFVADTADSVQHTRDRTTLRLGAELKHCYDRETVVINANVAPATHGETVSELLGSGDAAARDQSFTLKQAPLTYVSAETPSGRASTLEVRVDDALWREVPTLYAAGSRERVYTVRNDDAAHSTIAFGDGTEGARLPTGQHNLRARYRKGLGAVGNVKAGQLTTLLTRPLGVTGATNSEAAAGGEDAEPLAAARRNAPLTVLTLERAVSQRDYEDFARGFAGIDKAHALWIESGPARGVLVTLAGPGGAAVAETGTTYRYLVAALRKYGDPLIPLRVGSYRPAAFRLGAKVKVAADALPEKVLDEVRAALRAAFAFDAREFGRPVTLDEVVAVMHQVSGVVAVDIDALYRPDRGTRPLVNERLFAAVPVATDTTFMPAELLMLDATTLEIGAMP